MTRWIGCMAMLCLALAAVACQGTPVAPSKVSAVPVGERVRAVTFNIRVGYGTADWGMSPYELRHHAKDMQPIIDTLASLDPDVVALQEVLGAGQAGQIAAALGMNYYYAPHDPDWWGVALLSKYPMIDCLRRHLNSTRAIAVCKVGDGRRSISIASVHLEVDNHSGNTNDEVATFASTVPDMILMGDFNFVPGGPRYERLAERFRDTALVETERAAQARESGTYGYPLGNRIDYIFARRGHFIVADAGLADFRFRLASDHRAYFADLLLP